MQKFLLVLVFVFSVPLGTWANDALPDSLSVGGKAKDFILPGAHGQDARLYDALQEGPVVLSFYRGGWCPICNEQLQAYQARLGDIKALGGQLIAISPETPSHAEATALKNHLGFAVLSDRDNAVAKAYGIVWRVPDSHQEGFAQWLKGATGQSLADYNGQEGYELPVPATFVLSTDGTVVYAFKDVDYKKRASVDDILSALQSLR